MMRTRLQLSVIMVYAAVSMSLSSCGPSVVYRARPGFASSEELPDEVTLNDGTVIRYVSRGEYLARKRAEKEGREYEASSRKASAKEAPTGESFVAWDESLEGSVHMKAIMPEHVVSNAMRAFREERYGELWDQMVTQAVRSRAARDIELERANQPPDALESEERIDSAILARDQFILWCTNARSDVMTLLNRMSFGFSTNAIIMTKSGPTSLRLELTPQISAEFRYKVVDIEFEGDRVLLSGIH